MEGIYDWRRRLSTFVKAYHPARTTECDLLAVVEPIFEDTSIIVVVKQRKEKNYAVDLRYQKAWHLGFRNVDEPRDLSVAHLQVPRFRRMASPTHSTIA